VKPFFNINDLNKIRPGRGTLLLSEPLIDDLYFKRSVILLCDYNEEGAFGFVLNHYINIEFSEVIEGMPHIQAKISLGGPVSTNNLYYIHTLGESIPGSKHIVDDIYLGGEFDLISKMIASNQISTESIRFFVGYSGWSPGQLEEELKTNSWFTTKASSEIIMNTNIDKLWYDTLNTMGKKHKVMSNFPQDPTLN